MLGPPQLLSVSTRTAVSSDITREICIRVLSNPNIRQVVSDPRYRPVFDRGIDMAYETTEFHALLFRPFGDAGGQGADCP